MNRCALKPSLDLVSWKKRETYVKCTPLRTSVCLYEYIQSSGSRGPTLNGKTHNMKNNRSRNRLAADQFHLYDYRHRTPWRGNHFRLCMQHKSVWKRTQNNLKAFVVQLISVKADLHDFEAISAILAVCLDTPQKCAAVASALKCVAPYTVPMPSTNCAFQMRSIKTRQSTPRSKCQR